RNDRPPACSTSSVRPEFDVPSNACSTLTLSGASPVASVWLTRAAREAARSIWQISASDTPGETCPGQRAIHGTLVPPSKLLYLPPRNGPAGLWLPNFATASSL